MKRGLGLAVACTAALMLTGAVAIEANAAYLGYGNGDPGNWDMWTEQHPSSVTGGAPASEGRVTRHAAADSGCAYLHQRAMDTGSAHWWHRYHACLRG